MIRMDIQTIFVNNGPVSSLIILKTRRPYKNDTVVQLPIKIGLPEATAISMGIEARHQNRPISIDVASKIIKDLGADFDFVTINEVKDTTFYALISLTGKDGRQVCIDARPSDAIALAVRHHVPIYATEQVLDTAALPNFAQVEYEEQTLEMAKFHAFVEGLSPEDFSS